MTPTARIADEELMELVRTADPLVGAGDPMTDDAAESLLQEVLASPPEERRPGTRRPTVVIRVAAVGAVAALGFGAAVALIGDDGGGVTPASAAVVKHAISALALPSGTILHVDMTGTQSNGDGTTVTWRDQSWQQNDTPYDRRQVETTADGTTESANVGEAEQLYDASANTIYASTATGTASNASHQRYWMSRGPRPGTFILRPTEYLVSANGTIRTVHSSRRGSVVITASQAKALRNGTDRVRWHHASGANTLNGLRLEVVPAAAATAHSSGAADPASPDFRNQILALLQSGGATLVGHATVDGRDTLEIASADGHTTYYVDPGTYAPVELDTTGTTGGVKLRFYTWELLPANDANVALLSLADQHPNATVDHSQADYVAAEKRLFPNG